VQREGLCVALEVAQPQRKARTVPVPRLDPDLPFYPVMRTVRHECEDMTADRGEYVSTIAEPP
jgi:hypothetical protein